MGKDPKKNPDEREEKETKALSWRERLDPDKAGQRWNLPSYQEMDARKRDKH